MLKAFTKFFPALFSLFLYGQGYLSAHAGIEAGVAVAEECHVSTSVADPSQQHTVLFGPASSGPGKEKRKPESFFFLLEEEEENRNSFLKEYGGGGSHTGWATASTALGFGHCFFSEEKSLAPFHQAFPFSFCKSYLLFEVFRL